MKLINLVSEGEAYPYGLSFKTTIGFNIVLRLPLWISLKKHEYREFTSDMIFYGREIRSFIVQIRFRTGKESFGKKGLI